MTEKKKKTEFQKRTGSRFKTPFNRPVDHSNDEQDKKTEKLEKENDARTARRLALIKKARKNKKKGKPAKIPTFKLGL